MMDAIILSDLHLGSESCQARELCEFLEAIHAGVILTRCLILNGDVFDSIDFRRLKKKHWHVLSLLRKLSDRVEIIWICGNHDGSAEIVSHLLGVTVENEFVLDSGGQRILILHGHVFDDFIDAHPILTLLGDCVYAFLQWLDRTHTVARWAKHSSKTFLRCAAKIEEKSREHARRLHCAAVCCGHTHHIVSKPELNPAYYNSGCWTELPCGYLTVAEGAVRQHTYQPEFALVLTEEQPALVSS